MLTFSFPCPVDHLCQFAAKLAHPLCICHIHSNSIFIRQNAGYQKGQKPVRAGDQLCIKLLVDCVYNNVCAVTAVVIKLLNGWAEAL